MDRNRISRLPRSGTAVALRKESVDRNGNGDVVNGIASGSLSARRAWIEIPVSQRAGGEAQAVALRKESVDRNLERYRPARTRKRSLSARRAWIEIKVMDALQAEG